MTRLTFTITLILGFLTCLLAGFIRIELASPGLTTLTAWLGRGNIAEFYGHITHAHGLIATAMFLFVAAFLSYAAADKGATHGGLWGSAATLIGGMALFLSFWEIASHIWPNIVPAYPEAIAEHSTIEKLTIGQMAMSEDYFRMAALTLTLLGSAAVISIQKPYRLGAALLSVLTLMVFVVFSLLYFRTNAAAIGLSLYVVPEVVLLAILAMVMIDPAREDEAYLTVGVGLVLISGLAFDLVSTMTDDRIIADSYYFVANKHMAQHGMMLFAWFTAISLWLIPDRATTLKWIHAGLIGLGLAVTYLPMMTIGQSGGQRRMPNSVEDFPDLHYLSSIGAGFLILMLLFGLAIPLIVNSRRG